MSSTDLLNDQRPKRGGCCGTSSKHTAGQFPGPPKSDQPVASPKLNTPERTSSDPKSAVPPAAEKVNEEPEAAASMPSPSRDGGAEAEEREVTTPLAAEAEAENARTRAKDELQALEAKLEVEDQVPAPEAQAGEAKSTHAAAEVAEPAENQDRAIDLAPAPAAPADAATATSSSNGTGAHLADKFSRRLAEDGIQVLKFTRNQEAHWRVMFTNEGALSWATPGAYKKGGGSTSTKDSKTLQLSELREIRARNPPTRRRSSVMLRSSVTNQQLQTGLLLTLVFPQRDLSFSMSDPSELRTVFDGFEAVMASHGVENDPVHRAFLEQYIQSRE
uniref:Uncharacterized protein n=1 Tax=Rhizochromulina marina TaxID=1034831 RepID=A0A7S2WR53_9STRA